MEDLFTAAVGQLRAAPISLLSVALGLLLLSPVGTAWNSSRSPLSHLLLKSD